MDIAFLDSWIQTVAEGSGTAASIGGLGRALTARGHRVTRFAPISPWPRTLTLRRLLFNLQLPALLRRLTFDLIVGFDFDGFLLPDSIRRAVPYVVSIKGIIAEELLHERGRTRLLFQAFARLEAHNARQAQLVVTDSIYGRNALCRHYDLPAERVRLVPAGIDLARWNRIAAETPRASDGATILCVARQYPRKHVADLLRALPLVRKAVPRARALIVGDGPEHARLRALAAQLGLGDAALFLGAIPDDDEVARMYRRADLFCLPSVQENFGMVFVEAMASGLPIVATWATAIPEVVPHGKAGLLVPPGDIDSLAESLITLLRDPEQRQAMGAFGQERARDYEWDRVAGRFLHAIEPLLQRVPQSTPADLRAARMYDSRPSNPGTS